MLNHDIDGRIFDVDIQEGKGDILMILTILITFEREML